MSRRAMDDCVLVLGLSHPFTQNVIWAYFRAALTEGIHWEQAQKDLEQLLDRSHREPGPEAKITGCVTATGLALLLRAHGRFTEARPLLEQTLAEALRLRKELPKPDVRVDQACGLTQFLLGRWPGLAPGISPAERPPASFTIDAPFRAVSPVADGRIAPGEYGPGVEATFHDDANPGRAHVAWERGRQGVEAKFDDDANPGRLRTRVKSRSKTPDDLSFWVHTAYSERSLFLAFRVRDQQVNASDRYSRTAWANDSVFVFINGDHVANDMPSWFLYPNVVAPGNREGFRLIADAGGHQYCEVVGFTNADWKVGTSRTADGYIVEFEIPLALIDTRDGPEYVPATSGSELLVNFMIADNDAPVTAQIDNGIFWAEDPILNPGDGGEDFWTVGLRLVPKSDGNARAGSAHPAELRPKGGPP
jgi:hypothetical protein